jgi:hypothetical protein
MLAAAGCTGETTSPTPLGDGDLAYASAVKFWDSNAASQWNALATDLTNTAIQQAIVVDAIRMYAYLSLAQYKAAEAAEAAGGLHPPTGSATAPIVGGADCLLPQLHGLIAAELDGQEAAAPGQARSTRLAAGVAIGEAIAARCWPRRDRPGSRRPASGAGGRG